MDVGALGVLAEPLALEARADEVKQVSEWIGLFEWLVWSELRHVNVHLLFGINVLNVRAFVGASAIEDAGTQIHRACGVGLADNVWLSAAPQGHAAVAMNHWVIGDAHCRSPQAYRRFGFFLRGGGASVCPKGCAEDRVVSQGDGCNW